MQAKCSGTWSQTHQEITKPIKFLYTELKQKKKQNKTKQNKTTCHDQQETEPVSPSDLLTIS